MIDIRNVSKAFRRGNSVVEALRDFNLTIGRRESRSRYRSKRMRQIYFAEYDRRALRAE